MKTDSYMKIVLTVIAVNLTVISVKNLNLIPSARAANIEKTAQPTVNVPVNADGSINVKISNEGLLDVRLKEVSTYYPIDVQVKNDYLTIQPR